MDSASGSMQSSSGGDDDYDSRAESIPALYSNSFSPYHQTHHNNSGQHHMLDPLFYDPNPNNTFQRSPSLSTTNPFFNRSTDLMNSFMPPPPPTHNNQSFGSGQGKIDVFPMAQQNIPQENNNNNSRGGLLLASVSSSGGIDQSQVQAQAQAQAQGQSNSNNNSSVRNPKKRSRASRRAPTTVLTTDTTNFRAMVQEFTGIPAPPFSSSPFPRPRLDLFSSSSPSSLRSPHFDPPFPPYLLRPFPHKLHTPSPLSSFPTSTTPPNSVSYQQMSMSMSMTMPPLNMHTPSILNFQSILQPPPPKFPLSHNNASSASAQASLEIPPSSSSSASHLKMGVLEELGLTNNASHVNAGGFHRNLATPSSEGRRDDNSFHGIGGNYLGSNATESNFHGEKGTDQCLAASGVGVPRSEGMVESWINCSSE